MGYFYRGVVNIGDTIKFEDSRYHCVLTGKVVDRVRGELLVNITDGPADKLRYINPRIPRGVKVSLVLDKVEPVVEGPEISASEPEGKGVEKQEEELFQSPMDCLESLRNVPRKFEGKSQKSTKGV